MLGVSSGYVESKITERAVEDKQRQCQEFSPGKRSF